jgi:diguanylate cyclase (GGDEF)-like protein
VAAPSDSNKTKTLPFFDLVDHIPGFIRAGIAALAMLALAIWAAWVRARRRLARNAFVDPVTGIANAPAFEGLLAGELERAKRYKRPLALLVVEVSDAPHLVLPLLDQTLRDVTAAIQERLRAGDIIARLGPSRFAIICPEATTTAGETLARALEARLEEMRVHVAVGTAERQPTDLGPEQILSRAEEGLADRGGPAPGADRAPRRALLRVA